MQREPHTGIRLTHQLHHRAGFDHRRFFNVSKVHLVAICHVDRAGSYWYGGEKDIQRIIRINDSLLTFSNSQVQSTTWPGIKTEGKVELK